MSKRYHSPANLAWELLDEDLLFIPMLKYYLLRERVLNEWRI